MRSLTWLLSITALLSPALVNAASPIGDSDAVLQYAAQSGERIWRAALDPDKRNPGSRDLFNYALALCEAKQHPERLEKLFEVATKMQDRDPASRSYGNFRWSWTNEGVLDYNAVEFSMQTGSLVWLRHRDTIPTPARDLLQDLLKYSVEGCLKHKVRPSYTNISLMNASNLILLGEMLDRPDVAAEGQSRLDAVVLEIWNNGIAEYCSPTYYGTDLEDLSILETFTRSDRARSQARALLELFWTDIAANYYPPNQKLAGTRSRDYDYLRGLGILHNHLWGAGWYESQPCGNTAAVFQVLTRWRPSASLKQFCFERYPRLVRQQWGAQPEQTRTHYLLKDVTLSTSGAYYGGRMDLPLTADFPGPIDSVRCFFIADGRQDPYGKLKISDGKAHAKVFHLDYYFAAAQRRLDAAALVVYREKDLAKDCSSLQTHFVMPLAADGFWVGDQTVKFAPKTPLTVPVKSDEVVVIRKGTAAVAIRMVWTRTMDGQPAKIELVNDGNPHGAVRLTADHRLNAGKIIPAAALWVRAGSGLTSDAAFDQWRRNFAAAPAKMEISDTRIVMNATALDGPLTVGASSPFAKGAILDPAPERLILQVDNQDLGRRILSNIEPIKSLPKGRTR